MDAIIQKRDIANIRSAASSSENLANIGFFCGGRSR